MPHKTEKYDEDEEVPKMNSSLRLKITCTNRPGITQYLDEKPTAKCPICLEFFDSTRSCMTVQTWTQQIQRKNNFFGSKKKYMPKPEQFHHKKTMETARISTEGIAKKRARLLAKGQRA